MTEADLDKLIAEGKIKDPRILISTRPDETTEKRIIHIDTSLPRDSRAMIESFKEAMKKRKFSIENFIIDNKSFEEIMKESDERCFLIPEGKEDAS